MATLPIDYKDPILNTEVNIRKKYNVIENADGTISLEETTVYLQAPSKMGAGAFNTQNVAINGKFDASKLLTTKEQVSAVTVAGNGMDALVGKEIINSLNIPKLWTNPSPTSAFAAQPIALSETLSNFVYYEIIYALINSQSDIRFSTGKIPVGSKTRLTTSSSNNAYREISAIGGTNITFLTGKSFGTYGGTATDNSALCIPCDVLAYRH